MIDMIINGESAMFKGLYVTETPQIPTTKPIVETVTVPGRTHGTLTHLNGYNDLSFTISLGMFDPENFKQIFRAVVSWLHGAETLAFSDEPDMYYKVKSLLLDPVDSTSNMIGQFSITVTADPFIYKSVFPIAKTEFPIRIYNEGTMVAEPKFTLYGTGDLEILINAQRVKVAGVTDYVVIDSELIQTYTDAQNMETALTGDYPTLDVGFNDISVTGVTKLVIEPNWRWLT